MLNSEAAQSLPHLSGTLCSNALPVPIQSHHASVSPFRLPPWQMEEDICTQVDSDLQTHSRPPQSCPSQRSTQPARDDLRNSKCFFFLLPGTHPPPSSGTQLVHGISPAFRLPLRTQKGPPPGPAASGLLPLPHTFSDAGATTSTPQFWITAV